MARDQPRLSFWASIGPTRRRADEVATSRVDELDQLSDEVLLQLFPKPVTELVSDNQGRRYEVQVSVLSEGRRLELTARVADLPQRRTLVGHGFRRYDGLTTGRTALLYFQD